MWIRIPNTGTDKNFCTFSLSNLVHFHIRSYYKKGSNENRDAVELEHLLTKAITAVQNGDDVSSALGTR
jgi:hypothetical protein